MNAYDDLTSILNADENIEYIVFGAWGWNSGPNSNEEWELGFREPNEFVPLNKRGVLLTPEEARSYMDGWSFFGGFGSSECYSAFIWTTRRVIWVHEYDGSTGLASAPRNPVDTIPELSGN